MILIKLFGINFFINLFPLVAQWRNSPRARIILDKDLNIPISSRIVKSAKYYPTYVFFNKFTIFRIYNNNFTQHLF